MAGKIDVVKRQKEKKAVREYLLQPRQRPPTV
jgi:hypothetical protein